MPLWSNVIVIEFSTYVWIIRNTQFLSGLQNSKSVYEMIFMSPQILIHNLHCYRIHYSLEDIIRYLTIKVYFMNKQKNKRNDT